MLDLGVRAGQRIGGGLAQGAGDQGHQPGLVGPLVVQQVRAQPDQEPAHRREVRVARADPVGHRPDLLDDRQRGLVLGPDLLAGGHVRRRQRHRVGPPGEDRPQGQPDRQHVDALLEDRPRGGRQPAERRDGHGGQREPHADADGLPGDPAGPLGDEDRVGEGVDTVHREHDAGGLRGGGGPPGGQRDADVGGGQRRGVVDPVAHHHGDRRRALRLDHGQLLRRVAAGAHDVGAHHAPHGLGGVEAVPRQQHHAPDAGGAQAVDHARRVGPDHVLQQEAPRPAPRRPPRTPSWSRPARPGGRPAAPIPGRARGRSTPASRGPRPASRRRRGARSRGPRRRRWASPGPAPARWRPRRSRSRARAATPGRASPPAAAARRRRARPPPSPRRPAAGGRA